MAMRVMIVGPEIRARSAIKDYGGVWSFYLTQELRRRDCEVVFAKGSTDPEYWRTLNVDGVEHVVGLNRYWSKVPVKCAAILRERVSGSIGQIADCRRNDTHIDFNFMVRNDGREPRANNVYVGWAADKDLLQPNKSEELCILIDHPNYGLGRREDWSKRVLEDVAKFVKSDAWGHKAPAVEVLRIEDGAVRPVDLDKRAVPTFTRKHIPFEDVCQTYARAHVFLVTHPESLGLSVLETAMAGALVVSPRGFIQPELLETVRHIEWDNSVPWQRVLDEIDPATSRAVAGGCSWERVVQRMMIVFWRFSRRQSGFSSAV